MLKKSLVAASVLVACVVAWGFAQENQGPSILTKPIQSTGGEGSAPQSGPPSLSAALKSAQQNAVKDYSSSPQELPASSSVQPTTFDNPAARGDGDLEVPSILSGRGSKPKIAEPQPGPAVPSTVKPRSIGDAPGLNAPQARVGTLSAPPSQLPQPQLAQPLPNQPLNDPVGSVPASPSQPRVASPLPLGRPLQPATGDELPETTRPARELGSNELPSNAAPRTARTIEFGETTERTRPIAMGIRGPALRVDAVGPGSISVGKAADYEVSVVNLGSLPAEGVLVAVDFPASVAISVAQATNGEVEQTDGQKVARVIWTVANIDAGGEQRLALKLTPQANQAFNLNVEWTFVPLASTAEIEVTQPKIDLAIDGPTEVLFGQEATFKFVVTNSGTGDAENVTVELPEGLGAAPKNLGTIAAGQSRSFEIDITAVDAGEVTLGARAVADGDLVSDGSLKFVVRRGRLEVGAAGPDFKYAGTVATYDLVIKNSGDAAAMDVIAAAALPTGAEYVDGIPGGEEVEGGIRWDIGQLNPGEQREYAIRCILNTAGETQFEAGARGAGNLAAANRVATKVEAVADLTLVVDDPKGPKPVGEEVTYTLRIKNRGSKSATEVNLLSQFSDGIEPSKVVGGMAELVPGQVIFKPIPQIKPGEEVIVEIKAVASAEGNHVFRTELTCDTPETRRLFEGTTRFFGSARAAQSKPPASSGGGFNPSGVQR